MEYYEDKYGSDELSDAEFSFLLSCAQRLSQRLNSLSEAEHRLVFATLVSSYCTGKFDSHFLAGDKKPRRSIPPWT